MGYATSRQTALCRTPVTSHPTKVISDKISAAMLFVPRLLPRQPVRCAGTATTWCCWMTKPSDCQRNHPS